MIRTCPICNRNFETLSPVAVYCNLSCRKKAGREKEKEKQSAFYSPKVHDERVLWTLIRPSLEQVQDWARMLEAFVRLSRADRGVMIYGTVPDGWTDTEHVILAEQYGSTPKCWALSTYNLPLGENKSAMLAPPVTKPQREQAIAAMSEEDKEIERKVMEEL